MKPTPYRHADLDDQPCYLDLVPRPGGDGASVALVDARGDLVDRPYVVSFTSEGDIRRELGVNRDAARRAGLTIGDDGRVVLS